MKKFIKPLIATALQLLIPLCLLQSTLLIISAQPDDLDFSYMKSVKNANDMPLQAEYDYIVIGGGTAGCPLAATLSSKYEVLLLERGGPPTDNPNVLHADGFVANLMEEDNESTPAQKFTSEDGVVNVRGRVLGGSSMINGGFYTRGDEDFFKVSSGIDWDMDGVEDSYQWVEESVSHASNLLPFQSDMRDALLQAGVGPDNKFTLSHLIGTKKSSSIFDSLGRRHGAVQLLNKANLKKLQVVVYAYVERIILTSPQNSGLYVKGVNYTDTSGRLHQAMIRDKGEVILSTGAIGSPQLLLLSGIGPQTYLSSLKIPVVHDLPNVGKFVYDNPRNNIAFMPPFGLNGSFIQVVGVMKDQYIESISSSNYFSFPPPFGLFPVKSSPVNLDTGFIFAKIARTLSTGSFELVSSNDVKVTPKVRYNYFSNALDLAHCVTAMRKIGKILETPALDKYKFVNSTGGRYLKFLGPTLPSNQSDDASMEAFCRDTITTIWHYHGGCVVDKVVDSSLRVKGIENLRVVDGSIFTVSPGANPQATLMMLGRYMGLKILKQRVEKLEPLFTWM